MPPTIGIITGSGTYALPDLEPAGDPVVHHTRFGLATVSPGTLAGRDVLHLSRHLPGHARLSNHVDHRANVLALQAAGADAVLAVTVCGAVDPSIELGSLLCFEDLHFLVNRLPNGEICTLHDTAEAPGRGHWVYEDPFSAPLRAALLEGARASGAAVVDGGVYGHVDGPRFNTKAEIRSLALAGVTAVSQTAGPETALFGEAGIPYALLGFATDYANGVKPEDPTPPSLLMELIGQSTATFAGALREAVQRLDAAPERTGMVFEF